MKAQFLAILVTLYHSLSPPRLRDHCWRAERLSEPEAVDIWSKTLFAGHMNSQRLWLYAQDICTFKLDKISAWRGVYQIPLLAEVLWTMMAAGKRRKSQFSLYAAPHATCVSVEGPTLAYTLAALSKLNGFLKKSTWSWEKGVFGDNEFRGR